MADLASAGCPARGLTAGKAGRPMGVVKAALARGDAAGARCSRALDAVGVGEAPDPASGGDGAA